MEEDEGTEKKEDDGFDISSWRLLYSTQRDTGDKERILSNVFSARKLVPHVSKVTERLLPPRRGVDSIFRD